MPSTSPTGARACRGSQDPGAGSGGQEQRGGRAGEPGLLKVIQRLHRKGAVVEYHDPFIPIIPVTREHPKLAGRGSKAIEPGMLARYDAVLIATDHDAIDIEMVVDSAKLVVDTRNACQKAGLKRANVVKA